MCRCKVISFDLDGTLVSPKFVDFFWNSEIPRLYAEMKKIGFEEARKYVLEEYDKVGKDDIRWYLPFYWIDYFGLKVDLREVLNGIKYTIEVYPEVPEVLEELTHSYRLIIASGMTREFIDSIIEAIGDYFTSVFSSVSDFKQVGKSADFYLKICDKLRVKPEEVVHVGDHKEFDYEIPRKVCIEAYLIRRGEEGIHVIKDLNELKSKISC